MAGKKLKWEHWAIVALIGVLVFFWVTWPKPKPDERILQYEKVIEDQQVIIDSLSTVLEMEAINLIRHQERADSAAKAFQKTIANQRQQIKDNETIHELPTSELDSIVRILYGEGAI